MANENTSEKWVQVNVRVTESDYRKLTIRAIQESTEFNLVTVLDIVRMLIQKYLTDEKK